MKIDELLNNLIILKLMEFIKKTGKKEEETKPTPREEFTEMYVNPNETPKKEEEPDVERIMTEYEKHPIDQNIIMQKLEAITKEKEFIKRNKEKIAQEREQLEDQHKSLQRAKLEAERNG